jgi:photosystem II stability/assembly factor-like uncharacterized protein
MRKGTNRLQRCLAGIMLIAVIIGVISGTAMAGINQWTSIGPEGGEVNALALTTGPILYAGTSGGLFKSTDGTTTWTSIPNNGLTSINISAVAADPANPTKPYVIAGQAIYQFDGSAWVHKSNGLDGNPKYCLVLDPATASTMYVGGYSGVYKSTDRGSNWTAMNTGLTNTNVLGLAVHPSTTSTVFAGTANGIFKSTNEGANWVASSTGLPANTSVRSILFDKLKPTTIYLGTSKGVYKSTDSGANWASANTGMPGGSTVSLSMALVTSSSSNLYAALWSYGIYRSSDGGANWTAVNSGPASAYINTVLATGTTSIYAGTEAHGVIRSSDSGATWTERNSGLVASGPAFAVAPNETKTSSIIYAGENYKGGLFKSTNSGTTWTNILSSDSVSCLAIAPGIAGTVYRGDYMSVYKSTDSGSTWSNASTGLPSGYTVSQLAIDPKTTTTLFARLGGGGIYKTTDGGGTWSVYDTGLPGDTVESIVIDPNTPSTLYAVLSGGKLYKSIDGGYSWNIVNTSLWFYSVAFDPTSSATLYAGCSTGVHKSSDGGATWQLSNTGLPGVSIRNIAVDPKKPERVYIAMSTKGVFQSLDSGGTWTAINSGFPAIESVLFKELAIDPVNNSVIYVSTYGHGMWKYQAADLTLTAPVGGETWVSGQTGTIAWTVSNAGSNVKIELSRDSGNTWSAITNSTSNTGSYSWTVSGPSSSACRIRVTSTAPGATDMSTADFTIVVPTISVTAPNGGDTWYTGESKTITWTSASVGDWVKIEQSSDGGATWSVIANSTENDGSYTWTVGGAASANSRIRITSTTYPAASDASNAGFTIAPRMIFVTSPNGGEKWFANDVRSLTWNSGGAGSTVKIELSRDSGATWTVLAPAAANSGSYSWTVSIPASTKCRVRITSIDYPTVSDTTNADFEIINSSVRLLSPNGGEIIPSGSQYSITWTAAQSTAYVKLQYSLDNGTTWTLIARNIGGTNPYAWTVPAPANNAPNCLVKVTAFNASGTALGSDQSNGPFIIEVIKLASPNGGGALKAGTAQTITWNTNTTKNPVTRTVLHYTTDNGATWTKIIGLTGNPGTYAWTVPVTSGNKNECKVKVTAFDASNLSVGSDVSDAPFTIEVLKVNSPNGGQNLVGGSMISINYTISGLDNVAKAVFSYTLDGGTTWNVIGNNTTNVSPGTYDYAWTVPAVAASKTKCKVKVVLKNSAGTVLAADVSDAFFTISPES